MKKIAITIIIVLGVLFAGSLIWSVVITNSVLDKVFSVAHGAMNNPEIMKEGIGSQYKLDISENGTERRLEPNLLEEDHVDIQTWRTTVIFLLKELEYCQQRREKDSAFFDEQLRQIRNKNDVIMRKLKEAK